MIHEFFAIVKSSMYFKTFFQKEASKMIYLLKSFFHSFVWCPFCNVLKIMIYSEMNFITWYFLPELCYILYFIVVETNQVFICKKYYIANSLSIYTL